MTLQKKLKIVDQLKGGLSVMELGQHHGIDKSANRMQIQYEFVKKFPALHAIATASLSSSNQLSKCLSHHNILITYLI